MSPENLIQNAIAPVLRLLPAKMTSDTAIAMLVSIALQESRIEHRRQIGGPARGYWQFEQGGGVKGVLTHPATAQHIHFVLDALDYNPASSAEECWIAIEHNDILAAAFARLLLFSLPDKLPAEGDADSAWSQYLLAWRPGKPHRDTFDAFYAQAWDTLA